MKKTSTKRALIFSALSLLMCFVMLLGTTFAWFTDSVTSTNNIITSGNLDVELEWYDPDAKAWVALDKDTNVFTDDLWEPGHTEVVYLKVINKGTLALKYQLGVNVVDEVIGKTEDNKDIKLSDYIKYGVNAMDNDADFYADRDAAKAAVTAPANLNVAYTSAETELLPTEEICAALVVYMPESVGNEANYRGDAIPTITLGINVVATQLAYESDSFDNKYDEDSYMPVVDSVKVPAGATEAFECVAGDVTVTIPAGSPAGDYELKITNEKVATDANGETTAAYDISLYKDGVLVSGTIEYPVEIEVGAFLNVTKLLHKSEEITNFAYDAVTGIVSFTTRSFSPFEVIYTELGEGMEIEDGKIVAGVFAVNPADYDPTLAEVDSEYIAINYTVDGKTLYTVSERATTVVLGASDTVYTPENGNYTVKNASGKLWSEISALQNNEHSTVYLLPGTYNEGTTIGVYSSMDIIGLGDKDSVKVIKQSSSDSNRHLFNCSGTKADYIEVTLSNLYLDATAKTTGGKDNAAVQSIRKSKVKCYNLDIIKGTGGVAFYVNGNNAVDGVKYPAYLYAENCSLNTTQTYGVVTTNGTYKFYHSGLTYGGKAYTSNSGSIKNVIMEADDWDWDN